MMRDFILRHSDLEIDIICPYQLRATLINIYAIEGPLRGRSVYKVLIALNIWRVIYQKGIAAEIWILREAKGKSLNFVQLVCDQVFQPAGTLSCSLLVYLLQSLSIFDQKLFICLV